MGRTRFPWLLKVCVPNHEPKRSLSWNGERCGGWLSPKPRSDLTVPPARLAIGSSFPSDTNCGFMRFLSCLQIFVSHPDGHDGHEDIDFMDPIMAPRQSAVGGCKGRLRVKAAPVPGPLL